jgi:GMP synthase-like glutamine amidotransferase
MSSTVILQHVAHEGPGRIVPIFRDYGIPVQLRRLYQGDEVPTDLDEVRVLVLLGGTMSIPEVGSGKYPFLSTEIEVLKRFIAADRPVLGIDLGAQLLAFAAGAKVYPNHKPGATPQDQAVLAPELGWGPVTFPFPGGTEPLVTGLTDNSMMFQWHFDTFDLPKLPAPANHPPPPAPPPPAGNSLLSSSRLCKNQAFRFKNRLFGFQYHFEFTEADIDAVIAAGRQDISKVLGPEGEKTIRAETAKHYPRYARQGERLVRNFVQFLKVY